MRELAARGTARLRDRPARTYRASTPTDLSRVSTEDYAADLGLLAEQFNHCPILIG